jgi:hypothetical protein
MIFCFFFLSLLFSALVWPSFAPLREKKGGPGSNKKRKEKGPRKPKKKKKKEKKKKRNEEARSKCQNGWIYAVVRDGV